MTPKRLRDLFGGHDDLEDYVVLEPVLDVEDALLASWRCASADAVAAYENWRRTRHSGSYATYRARADRADAAQDALAARFRSAA